MLARPITVCEDETFHPQTCPVGLEPVSGFILLERYADDRTTFTWDQALAEATRDLPVEVIQVTSSQAKGLCQHIRNLGNQASPDLFHIQRDIVKATGGALRRTEKASRSRAVAAAHKDWLQARQEAADQTAKARRPGLPFSAIRAARRWRSMSCMAPRLTLTP
jgi:hypothetical protein